MHLQGENMTVTSVLTPEEKQHFLDHGWVKYVASAHFSPWPDTQELWLMATCASYRIPQAFTREQAAEVTQDVWTRLGMDPEDKSTWHALRTNMPSHRTFDASELAPRAWAAICELCGGEVSRPPMSPARFSVSRP